MTAPAAETDGPPPGFAARLSQFARLLRDNGFAASQAETVDAIRFLAGPDRDPDRNPKTDPDRNSGAPAGTPGEPALRAALRALYCSRRSELERFDELFDAYWNRRVGRRRARVSASPSGRLRAFGEHGAGAGGAQGLAQYFDWARDADTEGDDSAGEASGPANRLGGASGADSVSRQDFGKVVDPDEAERLLALADRLGARLRYRLSRRRKESRRGRQLSLRRTFRRSLPTGGVPLDLVRRVRREPPVNLIAFVDVSGSMDAYSLFFMRFVHALTGRLTRAEAFLFHTRLVHITGTLREADPIRMMEKMALISQGWSGGTRIGESIETFNALHADRYANARSIALILSDGYDTGEPGRLAAALAGLRRRCGKVIWLNPLLGRAAYEPVARGMEAARPHLDLFAPAHNLESLAALEDALVRA